MEELKDNRGAANIVEGILRRVPGFGGYLDRERRRDADKLQREFLAKCTTEIKRRIQDIGAEMLNNGDMSMMTKLDGLTNRLDRVTERTRHASQGYAGFFEINQVNSEELDRIYEHDLSLHNEIEKMEETLNALQTAVDLSDNVAPRINDLQKHINSFDQRLNEREAILKGVH